MDLEWSEEQSALRASVARFCEENITNERLQLWDSDGLDVDEATWGSIAELGWMGIAVPAEQGGSGLGLAEAACILDECGRGLIPRRVSQAIANTTILALLEPGAPELEALGRGEARLAVAGDERDARQAASYATRVEDVDGGVVLRGEKFCVIDPGAKWHLVAARDGNGVALAIVDGGAAELEMVSSFDGSLQAAVRYDGAPRRVLARGTDGAARWKAAQRCLSALALAEMVGGMDAALATTTAYVQEREQFGQKLAVFQAVQHQVADMALACTASRHLAWQAITRIAKGSEEGVELETAQAYVGRSFKDVTIAAHHLHGGAGYVIEHPLHYHAERAQSLAIRYAPEGAALDAVAAQVLGEKEG